MDGPKGNVPDNDMHSLYFQDLVILRQFIEKGFRENLFTPDEEVAAEKLRKKLCQIITDVMEREKKKKQETIKQ